MQASRRYLAVARSMKQYEDALYEEWVESVGVILPNLLKRTVLTKPTAPTQSVQSMESRAGSRAVSRADYTSFPQGTGNKLKRPSNSIMCCLHCDS